MAHADEPRASAPDERPETPASPAAPRSDAAIPAPADDPIEHPPTSLLGSGVGTYALTALIALACGLGGSYAYNRFLAQPHDPNAVAVAGRPAVAAPAGTGGAADNSLSDQVDRLKSQVADLKQQLADQAKPAVPPEVASIQVRLADLAEMTNGLMPLTSKVAHLTSRVSELSGQLNALREDVSSLQSRVGQTPHLTSAGSVSDDDDAVEPAAAAPPPDANKKRDDNGLIARGSALFRAGRYKEARAVFDKLVLSDPEDARVWYFAALSDGFATGDWTDSAAQLVEKGVAREQAGTPSSAEIDAAFKSLTTATGKDWLAAYRKRVKPRR